MIDKNTLIKDVEKYFYIGEFDEYGAFEKLHKKRIFVDNRLAHTNKNERCLVIYSFDSNIQPVFELCKKLFCHELTISSPIDIGQGFYGFNIYFDTQTIDYVSDVLRRIYLHIKLTNTL